MSRVHYKSVYGHWRVYNVGPFYSYNYKFKTVEEANDFVCGNYASIASFKLCKWIDRVIKGITV